MNKGATDTPLIPYWRLSSLYFFYFAVAGSLVPFWSLFLKDSGFDGLQIGWVLAIMSLTKVGAPNLWGWLADLTGKHTLIVQVAIAVCAVCFAGVWGHPGFALMLVVMTFYSFFWNAVLPQFEVITLHSLGAKTERYSQIRVWGSISFVVLVVGLGFVFDHISVQYLPAFVVAQLVALWLAALAAPHPHIAHARAERKPFLHYLRSPVVIAFMLSAILVQVAHGAYYSFFSLFMESRHYSRSMIGGLWAVGVVAEIVTFMYMHRIVARWNARRLMLFSVLISVVRWWVIAALPDQLVSLIVVQIGHAATFAIIHTVSIRFVHQRFPAAVASQGQALYSAVSFGVGGALGNLASGWLWQGGYLAGPFWMATLASILALVIVWQYFHPQEADHA